MAKLSTARVYEKRATDKSSWSGRIGAVTLEIESESDIVVTLDGKTLPASSVEHLMNFALQSLQDAYAGAADLAEAQGAWEKKRNRLYEGTLGTRDGSGGEEPWMRLVRDIIRTKMSDAKKAEYKALKGEGDARREYLDNIFEGLDDARKESVVDAAKKMLAAEIERKREQAAMASVVDGGF